MATPAVGRIGRLAEDEDAEFIRRRQDRCRGYAELAEKNFFSGANARIGLLF